jgi:hypothetical protein
VWLRTEAFDMMTEVDRLVRSLTQIQAEVGSGLGLESRVEVLDLGIFEWTLSDEASRRSQKEPSQANFGMMTQVSDQLRQLPEKMNKLVRRWYKIAWRETHEKS